MTLIIWRNRHFQKNIKGIHYLFIEYKEFNLWDIYKTEYEITKLTAIIKHR